MTSKASYGFILAFLMLFGLLGWLQAGTDAFTVHASQSDWRTPKLPANGAELASGLRLKIFGSGYFKMIGEVTDGAETQLNGVENAISIAENLYGVFPHIISISRIDERDTAQLRLADNQIMTVYSGDTLESGWVVTKILSDHLQADAGEESFSFAVFEHKNTQEQDSVDK